MSFLSELNRRNVIRVGMAYAVTAWLLIQVAETIFPLFGFDETPARIVVVVLAIGLIPTLILAWAFEWTPDGLKRDADVDRRAPATVDNARRLDRIIMAVLAVALGYFAIDKFVLNPAREAEIVESARQEGRADAVIEAFGDRSIAVLPFTNMSADPDQEYFSDGMAEELLNLLAKIPELRVISRSSSFTYKGNEMPKIPTIALELGVNYIVEGSVRKAGDTIRITAQLIEARSDRHLWSETYDRALEDVFAIQDEISAAIVGELKTTLALDTGNSPRVQAPTSTDAYEAYLRGKYLMAQRTADSLAAAVEEFGTAIGLDPDYALGHAALALATNLLVEYGGVSRTEAKSRVRSHADRALELDPELAEAHAAMAFALWGEELSLAQEHFRRAIELNPNYAEAYLWLGNSLMRERRYLESMALVRKAAQLDPLSLPTRSTYFHHLIYRGRLDEARRELDKLATLNPNGYFYLEANIALKSLGGNWADGASASLDGYRSGIRDFVVDLLAFCAMMGLESEASADFADLGYDLEVESPGIKRAPVNILLLLGRPQEAVTTFERIFGDHFPYSGILYGNALASAGDYDRAEPFLEEFSGGPLGLPVLTSEFLVLPLIAARLQRGDEAGVTEMQLALSDALRRYDEANIVVCEPFDCVHFERGISAYLNGDREEGLVSIARAVDEGYFIPPNHAYLQFLYDDPGFAPILEKQKENQAREREKFLAVVCENNPYPDVWQPAEGTCQEFRAGQR